MGRWEGIESKQSERKETRDAMHDLDFCRVFLSVFFLSFSFSIASVTLRLYVCVCVYRFNHFGLERGDLSGSEAGQSESPAIEKGRESIEREKKVRRSRQTRRSLLKN